MKVRRRLKRPARVTSYKAPTKVVLTEVQVKICKKLAIPLEMYARELLKFDAYQRRYCG